jgi:Site-specific DNA methylase
MRFGSVCSGIEAASVAWEPLGWKADWLAEIEPFPSAVLAHHYPKTPNLGDMTAIARSVLSGDVSAPDVLTGGTPCQAFSVAGMRGGLSDPRGELTIKFVGLADAIDYVREKRNEAPSIVIWENVPGVLSDKDNAFGCFLGALAGEDCELQPSGKKWQDAGVVCMDPKEQSRGGSWTPNISAWPNAAAVCSLWQVLEKGSIPHRYFLSAMACAGILRRAEARSRQLPHSLQTALEHAAQTTTRPKQDT